MCCTTCNSVQFRSYNPMSDQTTPKEKYNCPMRSHRTIPKAKIDTSYHAPVGNSVHGNCATLEGNLSVHGKQADGQPSESTSTAIRGVKKPNPHTAHTRA